MLASAPVRALADRRAIAAAAGVLCAAAVFLSAGLTLSRLVWIGAAGLLLAALAVVGSPRISGAAAAFLASLGGLAMWFGLTTLWSASPDRSWIYTNMTLVYLAFALLGVLAAVTPPLAFAVALPRPGLTSDSQSRSVRAHDGWVFAVAVVAVGLAVGAVASRVRLRESLRPRIERLAAIAGAAAAVAVVAVAI